MAVELSDLPSGVYRHYKGPLYLVLGYAHDANADEFHSDKSRADGWSSDPLFPEGRAVVVYVGLQLDEAHTGPRLAVRTAEDFHMWVHPDGTECPTHVGDTNHFCHCQRVGVDVKVEKRFAYLGPTWDGEL